MTLGARGSRRSGGHPGSPARWVEGDLLDHAVGASTATSRTIGPHGCCCRSASVSTRRVLVVLAGHRPERAGDHDLAAEGPRRELARIQPTPASGGSPHPSHLHDLGIEPRVAMPMPPHAVQSRARPGSWDEWQASRRRPCTAGRWPRRSRSARCCRSDRRRTRRRRRHPPPSPEADRQTLNHPVVLTSKTRSNSRAPSGRFGRSPRLPREQHVDAATSLSHLIHHGTDGVGVGEVDPEVVVGRAARRLDRLDAGEGGLEALDALARGRSPPGSACRRAA